MQIDGISSQRLDTQFKLLEKSLEIRRFTYTQYLDILRGLSEGVKDILNVYYADVHKDNLTLIINGLGRKHILPTFVGHGQDEGEEAFVHRISERFLRDLVSTTFGLQYLDNFLTKIHQTLALQKETLSEEDLDLLMTYDPDKAVSPIHEPRSLTNDSIHLGSKGYNLVVVAGAGIRVPPGFIITTEVARCHRIVLEFPQARADFLSQIREQIRPLEEAAGRRFGDAERPLLVSVRSGATISMPGMMDTLLNVGINEEIAEGMVRSSGNPWFAWDNYRRFLQSWGMSFGMGREAFNEIMRSWKDRYEVEHKRQFTGKQMREMAEAYRKTLEEQGIRIETDPWKVLETAIHQVIYSWKAAKAGDYREIMGISDDWGTAVIVQAMVFGNRGPDSGSGVLFTANPTKRMRRVVLWGDYTPMNQGEDIVGGLVSTYPISEEQRVLSVREGEVSLEDQFPKVYGALDGIAKSLVYERGWNPQEIEFTFEGPDADSLYVLQTRDMVTARRDEALPVFEPSPELHDQYVGKGIGVSGGALSGRAVFTLEEIRQWRESEPETALILIRSDTVPDDIKEISLSEGLLTAKGGQTSHAAIVALRLGKTCVVGCSGLKLLSDRGPCLIHEASVRSGEYISIDGHGGSIYLGRHPVAQKTGP
jgi:pyruvate,orthophosphate dikinase